jgi:hypothetical protein
VNITDPNNIPQDARVISADDLLRYEKLGVDVKAKFAEVDNAVAALDSDAVMSELIAAPASEVRYAVKTMVDTGVAKFKDITDAVPGNVAAQVPPLVTSALAADGTVSAAAASAVNGKLTEAGVFTGAFIMSNDTIAMSFVDQAGNRSWVEVGYDGAPTPESAAAIVKAITPALAAAIDANITARPGQFKVISDGSGVRLSFVDSEDRRSWIEIADDGGPTDNSIQLLQAKLNITGVPTTAKSAYNSADIVKVVSGPDITTVGDSMTAQDWSTMLANLTGRTVNRRGVGGESSKGIAARMNAMPYLMLPAGGAIPASGPVNVDLTSSGGGTSWPLLQGAGTGNGFMDGTLEGIPGRVTLTKGTTALPYRGNDDVYVFTRTTAGTAVPVTRPKPFYYTDGEAQRGNIMVIWSGRNNFTEDNGDRAFRDIKAMVNYMRALEKRFLVLSVHNGAGEGIGTSAYTNIASLNARLLAEYGRRFVDHRKYIIDYGLADAGITPTAQDIADVAADLIPTSLRSDTLHQNDAGKALTAMQVNLRLRELGWV